MTPGIEALEQVEILCMARDSKGTLSVIHWLLDLMCAVVLNEDVNKMTAKNMAIVMSPNLYSVTTENAMVALTMSQKVAQFCTVLLQSRLQVKYNYVSKGKAKMDK